MHRVVAVGALLGAVVLASLAGHAETVRGTDSPQAVATGHGSVWVADFADSAIERVDTAQPSQATRIPLELPRAVAAEDARFLPVDITVGAGAVWASSARGYVARIDPATNRVTAMIKTTGDATGPVAASDDAVWVGEGLRLGRIDPKTNALSRTVIDGPGDRRLNIGWLALRQGRLWVGGEWARPSRDAVGPRDYTVTGPAAVVEVDTATAHHVSRWWSWGRLW